MKILVSLNHPAHYYLFKNTVKILISNGYDVLYVIRNKDVLEDIMKCEKVKYIKLINVRHRKKNKISVMINSILDLIEQDFILWKEVKKYKPDLMIGTCTSITHIGKLLKIPTFMFNEDDFEINKRVLRLSYPFATKIIAPDTCSVGKYTEKKVSYSGYQKMAYLHPLYFKPDFSLIENIICKRPYYVIRLVSLTAGHDIIEGEHRGIDNELLDKIISKLSLKGIVFISSEKVLDKKYDKYLLRVKANLIHHVLAYADLFIGDSQTMCAEAGLLGTPFIRINDFVGKISYLNDIENNYGLGYGLTTNQKDKILPLIDKILSIPNLKQVWANKKDRLFKEKQDVALTYYNIINDYLTKRI